MERRTRSTLLTVLFTVIMSLVAPVRDQGKSASDTAGSDKDPDDRFSGFSSDSDSDSNYEYSDTYSESGDSGSDLDSSDSESDSDSVCTVDV